MGKSKNSKCIIVGEKNYYPHLHPQASIHYLLFNESCLENFLVRLHVDDEE